MLCVQCVVIVAILCVVCVVCTVCSHSSYTVCSVCCVYSSGGSEPGPARALARAKMCCNDNYSLFINNN